MVTQGTDELIEAIVEKYKNEARTISSLVGSMKLLVEESPIYPLIHSYKVRAKSEKSLRDKLARKVKESADAGLSFAITPDNLFDQITDLVGLRLIHLHTSQFEAIDAALKAELEVQLFKLREGPIARVWDDENKNYFMSLGVGTTPSNDLYTSVHYVVQPGRKGVFTVEIQVRTLAEELWGEVDHSMNYPHKIGDLACEEQIKVLARLTSTCSRMVDSIVRSREEFLCRTKPKTVVVVNERSE
jgi:putative GTP pyrophosphokinase